MDRLSLDKLLDGCAPVLARTLSTGALAKGDAYRSPESALEACVSTTVGQQVQRSLEAATYDALHCKVCRDWLHAPVTLSCGHSMCGAHTRADSAGRVQCPICGISDDAPVRDFFLQECVDQVSTSMPKQFAITERSRKHVKNVQVRKSVEKHVCKRGKSAPGHSNRKQIFVDGWKGVHCSICLETFPGPHRAPAILRCGHALCKVCLTTLQARRAKQRCPLCKATISGPARPSHALRSAIRLLNALPLTQGAQDLRCGDDDLHACHMRVKEHRSTLAVTRVVPLHEAIRRGDVSATEALVKEGADCNALVQGKAALHIAIEHRQFALVNLLLDHGADPSLVSPSLHTPLLMASAADNGALKSDPARLQAIRDMLQALGPEGARNTLRAANKAGSTPLLWIVKRISQVQAGLFSGNSFEQEVELAKLFVFHGADVEAIDMFGQTPVKVMQSLSRPVTLDTLSMA